MKATKRIIQLAANCGIDAHSLSIEQVRSAHEAQLKQTRFVDQHDTALTAELKGHDAAVKRSIDRMVGEVVAKTSKRT